MLGHKKSKQFVMVLTNVMFIFLYLSCMNKLNFSKIFHNRVLITVNR